MSKLEAEENSTGAKGMRRLFGTDPPWQGHNDISRQYVAGTVDQTENERKKD